MSVLRVQEYLRGGKSLSDLSAEHHVRVAQSELLNLAILNYSQIEGEKRNSLQRECRGLVLERGTWDVRGRSFFRFFNQGECPDLEKAFDWKHFSAEEKCDGSLMTLFRHQDLWMVTTRGSFADGEISPGMGKWEEHFWNTVGDEKAVDGLPENHSFVFEFCSRWNKVVRDYPEPTLFLLMAVHNQTGAEASEVLCDRWAASLGVRRPARYDLTDLAGVVEFVKNQGDPTFEGCVLRDRNGMRLKVKNASYIALHHLKDNGNIFLEKNLIPLVLKGEHHEALNAFPELSEKVFSIVEKVGGQKARLEYVWERARGIESQKDFAAYVNRHTALPSILFESRKKNIDPKDLFTDAADLLLKKCFA